MSRADCPVATCTYETDTPKPFASHMHGSHGWSKARAMLEFRRQLHEMGAEL